MSSKFRYIAIKVVACRGMRIYGSWPSRFAYIQFSEFRVIDGDGKPYEWPVENMTISSYTAYNGYQYYSDSIDLSYYSGIEDVGRLFDNDVSTKWRTNRTARLGSIPNVYNYNTHEVKMVSGGSYGTAFYRYNFGAGDAPTPVALVLDLGDNPLDISVYSRWQFANGNDNQTQSVRTWVEGEILVSNDLLTWYSLDIFNDMNMPNTNFEVAYTGWFDMDMKVGDIWYGLDLSKRNWSTGIDVNYVPQRSLKLNPNTANTLLLVNGDNPELAGDENCCCPILCEFPTKIMLNGGPSCSYTPPVLTVDGEEVAWNDIKYLHAGSSISVSPDTIDTGGNVYKFSYWMSVNWQGGKVISRDPSFVLDSCITQRPGYANSYLYCYFSSKLCRISVSVDPPGGGSVSKSGIIEIDAYYGTRTKVTATPSEGYALMGWYWNDHDTPSYTSATADLSCMWSSSCSMTKWVAKFRPACTITFETNQSGITLTNSGTYRVFKGESMSSEAKFSDESYRGDGWYLGDTLKTKEKLATFTCDTIKKETWEYKATKLCSVPISSDVTSGCGVSFSPEAKGPCNTTVVVTATPTCICKTRYWTTQSCGRVNSYDVSIVLNDNWMTGGCQPQFHCYTGGGSGGTTPAGKCSGGTSKKKWRPYVRAGSKGVVDVYGCKSCGADMVRIGGSSTTTSTTYTWSENGSYQGVSVHYFNDVCSCGQPAVYVYNGSGGAFQLTGSC